MRDDDLDGSRRGPAAVQERRGLFCLLGDLGSNQLAGAAPRREPVDDDDGVLGDGLLEGGGAGGHNENTVSNVEPASEGEAAIAAAAAAAVRAARSSLLLLAGDNLRLNVVDSHLGQRGVE